jgi:hypothetical protein
MLVRSAHGNSLDHLVGGDEQSIRYFEAKRLRGLEIDHELELCRQHNRQITRLLAFEDASRRARVSQKLWQIDLLSFNRDVECPSVGMIFAP